MVNFLLGKPDARLQIESEDRALVEQCVDEFASMYEEREDMVVRKIRRWVQLRTLKLVWRGTVQVWYGVDEDGQP